MTRKIPDNTDGPLAANLGGWLWVCVGVGLMVRLAWCLHLPETVASLRPLPDQLEYLSLARHWISTGTLSFRDERFGQQLFAYRTPGYPALIAICGASIRITRIVQALIDSSSILATGLLARRWLTRRASLLSAWIVCINPMLIYFTGLLLGETIFASLLVWGMVGLRERKDASRLFYFLSLSLAVLVRPSALLLPAMLAVCSQSTARRALRDGVIAMAMTLLVLLPWAIRNEIRLHEWIWLSTNGGITMFDGFNPSADGSSDQTFVRTMPELSGLSEVQRDRYLRQKALSSIQSNPARLFFLTIRKFARTWSPMPLSPSYRTTMLYAVVGLLYVIPLFVFAAMGLCGGLLKPAARVFLMVPAIYITAVHGLTVGSLRYRIPADIPLAVVAASGLIGSRLVNQHASSAE